MCSGRRSATLPRQRGAVSARAQGLGRSGTHEARCSVPSRSIHSEKSARQACSTDACSRDDCDGTPSVLLQDSTRSASILRRTCAPARAWAALRVGGGSSSGRCPRHSLLGGPRSLREQQWTRHTRRQVPSGDFIPCAGVQPSSFPRHGVEHKVVVFRCVGAQRLRRSLPGFLLSGRQKGAWKDARSRCSSLRRRCLASRARRHLLLCAVRH